MSDESRLDKAEIKTLRQALDTLNHVTTELRADLARVTAERDEAVEILGDTAKCGCVNHARKAQSYLDRLSKEGKDGE